VSGISGFRRIVFEASFLLGYYKNIILYLVTDVSGGYISLKFTGQAVLRNTPEDLKPYQ